MIGVSGPTRTWLRVEGLVLLVVAVAVFLATDVAWWWLPLLLLVPDVLALGYLAGPRVGAVTYNLSHSTIGPLLLGAVAWWQEWAFVAAAALIWLAHIGMDRALRYGLKYPESGDHTHLGLIGKARRDAAPSCRGAAVTG
jgi:hypothetical protein